jgi:hypothetical protein
MSLPRAVRSVLPVLALLALLAVAACAGSSSPAAQQTRVSPERTPSPTAAPTATRMPSPTPTPTAVAVPAHRPARDDDIDGDGHPDSVHVAATDNGDGTWTLVARLSALGRRSVDVPADTPTPPHVAGIVDADGDGYAEIWVQTGAGASTSFLTPVRLVGDRLRVVELNGSPAQLGEGGSVTHGDGFACTDADHGEPGRELVVYSGDLSPSGTDWDGSVTTYRWAGARLVTLSTHDESFPAGDPGSDPRVAKYYAVTCGSLTG